MKLLISIPNTKKSERFPGKNKLLSQYTVDWLNEELKNLPEEWEVKVLELVSPWTEEYVTTYDKFDVPYDNEHQKSLEYLQKRVEADLHIHVQVTQPKRRRGLFKDAVNTYLTTKADVISSYVTWRDDLSWRELKRNGNRVMFNKELRSEEHKTYYDGAIYVAKDLSKIFDTNAQWDWVYNYTGPVCDIDYREEMYI